MAGINPEVTFDGKLFTAPGPTMNYHLDIMSKEMAEQAKVAIKFQGQTSFRYERSPPTGDWSRSIKVTTTGSIGGLTRATVSDSGIIYGPWLEGVSDRNRATRFKGYHTFRKVAQEIDRKAPQMLGPQTRAMARDLER